LLPGAFWSTLFLLSKNGNADSGYVALGSVDARLGSQLGKPVMLFDDPFGSLNWEWALAHSPNMCVKL